MTFSNLFAQQRVKVNRWVSPVFKDFISIPENKSTDAQLISFGYKDKIFQYEAFLTRPAGNNVAVVNRWSHPNCGDFIIIAEHEISDQQMTSFGYVNKQFLFYAYKTRPTTGQYVAVSRWINTLPVGNPCRDFSLSVAEHELTDAQLSSWGYTDKKVQFYVPDPRASSGTNTSVVVYSNFNFTGQSTSYNTAGVKNVSFPVRSMKIGAGYEVVIQEGAEFPAPVLLNRDYGEVINTDCRQIVITATPSTPAINLNLVLRDVYTNIHNNDCKRVFGYINMSMILPNGLEYPIGRDNTSSPYYREETILSVLNWQPGEVKNVVQIGGNTPNLINTKIDLSRFRIDQAIQANTKLAFYIKLGSAHKGCDLCTDYTSNIGMAEQKTAFSSSLADLKTLPYEFPLLGCCGHFPANDGRHSFGAHIYSGPRIGN